MPEQPTHPEIMQTEGGPTLTTGQTPNDTQHPTEVRQRAESISEKHRDGHFFRSILYEADSTMPEISIPHETAPMKDWIELANQMQRLENSAKSFAVAAGESTDTPPLVSAEDDAMSLMTPTERVMYTDWKRGVELDEWDWEGHATAIGSRRRCAKEWNDKAVALSRIYHREGITSEQAKGWVMGHTRWTPIVHAMMRVIRAERLITGGVENPTSEEASELRFCRTLATAVKRKRKAFGRAFHNFTRACTEIETAIVRREMLLDGTHKEKKDGVGGNGNVWGMMATPTNLGDTTNQRGGNQEMLPGRLEEESGREDVEGVSWKRRRTEEAFYNVEKWHEGDYDGFERR